MSKTPQTPPSGQPSSRAMSPGQRAYEERRAGKAGVSLDKHLSAKAQRAEAEAKKAAPPPPPRPKGVIGRLLERARKPL